MYDFLAANYRWVEKKGYSLNRKTEIPYFIIVQYLTNITVTIGDQPLEAHPGNVLIVSPGTPHSYFCHEDLLHHWIHVKGDIAELLLRYGIEANRMYEIHNSNEVSFLFRQIAFSHHGNDPFRQEYLTLKLEELLLTIGAQISLGSSVPNLNYNVIERLKELRYRILEHPEQDWTIARMAEQTSLSASYFQQVYKEYYSVTPNQDLINIRIRHAQTNLWSNHSTSEVAERCGYKNVEHFVRQFKKVTGMTPGQFKRQQF